MAASAFTRLSVLFAVVCLVSYASCAPEPTYGCCCCRPGNSYSPCCRCSTTTCGALVVPTMATVHSKGCSRCSGGGGGGCGGCGCCGCC